MKECGVIEPQRLAGLRVFGERRPNCADPEPAPLSPFNFDAVGLTVLFHYGLIRSLKNLLPLQSKSVSEVPDIFPILLFKLRPDPRMNAIQHPATVSNERFASLSRWAQTKEVV